MGTAVMTERIAEGVRRGPGRVAGYREATCEREPAFIEKK